jgi:hypothetical protein
MGVDISGKKPKTEVGDYFQSNWWGWRPINYLCELAAYNSKLKINFENWGSNDGAGLKTQKQCDKLANALEDFLGSELRIIDDEDLDITFTKGQPEVLTQRELKSIFVKQVTDRRNTLLHPEDIYLLIRKGIEMTEEKIENNE